jgi:hypothetical protein
MITFFSQYWQRCQTYSTSRLMGEMVALSFFLKMIPGFFLELLGCGDYAITTDAGMEDGVDVLLIGSLLIAPPLETLIGQGLFVGVVSLFTNKRRWRLLIPTTIFSALHIYAGWQNFFLIFPAGFFFTWCFLLLAARSKWKAFWVTTLVHFFHNLVAVSIYLLFV